MWPWRLPAGTAWLATGKGLGSGWRGPPWQIEVCSARTFPLSRKCRALQRCPAAKKHLKTKKQNVKNDVLLGIDCMTKGNNGFLANLYHEAFMPRGMHFCRFFCRFDYFTECKGPGAVITASGTGLGQ